jgi:hypothetical protein
VDDQEGDMKWILIALIFSAGLRAQELPSEPFARAQVQQFLREAREAYAAEDIEAQLEAAQRFQALLEQAPEGELNRDALHLARGMSLLKADRPGEALQAFEAITGFEDPEERTRLRNLRGNAQMKIGQEAAAAKEWDQAKSSMEEAIESFINALRDVPTADPARHNLELAQKHLAEIIEQMPPPEEQDDNDEEEEEEEEDPSDEEEDPSDEEEPTDEDSDGSDESDPSDESDRSDQEDPTDRSDQTDTSDQQPDPSEDIDQQQAQQILDAFLEQEKHQRSQILQQRIQSIPVEKDW